MECITDTPASLDGPGTPAEVRIEAAHIIASLSYGMLSRYVRNHVFPEAGVPGSPDALRTLLRLNAAQPLLYAISTFQPSDPDALKAALARALRALSAAGAETVGPSQWGLSSHSSDLRREAKAALDYLFQVRIALLSSQIAS